eukprot:TRINITY_DN1198_c0_g1_i6.p1 TRINITY_DN1198_c0_g1~~TRINITY_DN1198_c0_g1_i6.p1  ORF type:complete len:122 (+),score=25.86 TRINITY_DN1198_c0_g1_i6:157-522(+)
MCFTIYKDALNFLGEQAEYKKVPVVTMLRTLMVKHNIGGSDLDDKIVELSSDEAPPQKEKSLDWMHQIKIKECKKRTAPSWFEEEETANVSRQSHNATEVRQTNTVQTDHRMKRSKNNFSG